jgi:hypothetical protein
VARLSGCVVPHDTAPIRTYTQNQRPVFLAIYFYCTNVYIISGGFTGQAN